MSPSSIPDKNHGETRVSPIFCRCRLESGKARHYSRLAMGWGPRLFLFVPFWPRPTKTPSPGDRQKRRRGNSDRRKIDFSHNRMPGRPDAVAKSDISLSALFSGAAQPVHAVVILTTMLKIKVRRECTAVRLERFRGRGVFVCHMVNVLAPKRAPFRSKNSIFNLPLPVERRVKLSSE